MKIIDLLNIKAKGEEMPRKIIFDTDRYYLNDNNHYVRECGDFIQRLDIEYNLVNCLNDEVEIIEEKRIDSIEHYELEELDGWRDVALFYQYKFNELIDAINDMRDKE